MIRDVVQVHCPSHGRSWLRFRDGVCGEVDVERLASFDAAFEPLRDPAYFARFHVDDTIAWPNRADFAPELLRESLLTRGE